MEKLLSYYVWGIYRMAIMPNNFPVAGMENPLLHFLSPTIFAKDHYSIVTILHEMSH